MLPCGLDPLGRHRYELEHKSLNAARSLEPEIFDINFCHYAFVEIAYSCSQQKECGVFGHERFWQPVPPKPVVHVVEYPFFAASEVVEFHDIPCARSVVVGQYAAVCVLALPEVEVAVQSLLSLDYKPVSLALPLLDED